MLSVYCPPDLANPFFPALGQAKQKPHGNARPPIALERPVKVAEELADFMIDAIFATSDVMAIGVLRKLREYGRTVPGKISVGGMITFLGQPLLSHNSPQSGSRSLR